MVREDRSQGCDVFWQEQLLQQAFWQRSKCGVSWGKHGEWAFALEGLNQAGCRQRGDKCGEVWVARGNCDDVTIGNYFLGNGVFGNGVF